MKDDFKPKKPKMGRPRKSEPERRDYSLSVRYNRRELEKMRSCTGESVGDSKFIRAATLLTAELLENEHIDIEELLKYADTD